MPASLERIRREMNVDLTRGKKGVGTTIKVTAYDNGMITVNGTPINQSPDYDQAGWLGALIIIGQCVEELQKVATKRRKELEKANA